MTKFELIQEYYKVSNMLNVNKYACNKEMNLEWSITYKEWFFLQEALLREMGKVKMRENETYEQYIERRRRLRETVFG